MTNANETFSLQDPDPSALALLSAESAEKLCAVPFRFGENGTLFVAMKTPNDILAVEELRILTGYRIMAQAVPEEEIRRSISNFYKIARSVGKAMQNHSDSSLRDAISWLAGDEPERLSAVSPDDAPVVSLLGSILERSVAERASDVHIEPGEENTRVRFRIDGILIDVFSIPTALHPALLARIKIKARMDIAEKRRPQDGRILVIKDEGKIDIRVSTIPAIHGEKAVMRILDQTTAGQSLDTLGFSETQQNKLDLLLQKRHGICMVTGPTGSGKSTTLYALWQRLKRTQVNIVTIEDPVEYTLPGVTQIQVNEKIGLSFSTLLRSVLRQDPDIIMIGEIRDTETAQLAVRAVLTGYLVLATLHTNDAPGAVSRLLDMGIPGFLLVSSLNGVVAQRLIRMLCPKCKTESPPGTFLRNGCPNCRGSGYAGRTAVAEIMLVDDIVRGIINAAAPSHQIREYAEQNGMQSLSDNAIQKVSLGISDLSEIYSLEN